jgi:pimeloyl-ACP methyl ester carboxylesterase
VIVFIHGVPETHTIWDKIAALIDEPSITLALPGFGNERPAGFTATKDDYLDWIISSLTTIDEPIDLVGHDWGAAFTLRLATTDTVSLRTWAADVTYLLHPDYVWHDLAQTWQQPGAGEDFWANYLTADPNDIAPVLEAYGLTHDDALSVAEMADATGVPWVSRTVGS